MLAFLKRLFPRQEPRGIQLAPADFDRWLTAEEREREKRCHDFILSWATQWQEDIAVCRERLDALGSAELVNPNIPEKHKSFMTGNRREYLRRVSAFLDSLSVPHSLNGARVLMAAVNERMPELARGLQRPAGILSEFFAVQVRQTQAALARIEASIKTLGKELDKELPPALAELRSILDQRSHDEKQAASLRASLKSFDHSLVLTERKLGVVRRNIASIEASNAHKNLQQLREALIGVQDRIRAAKTDAIAGLQQLNDAFARYAHAHPPAAKFLQTLNNDPLDVLEHHGARLINIIDDIKRRLDAQTLDLKDKKREKALAACATITSQWIDNKRTDLAEARAEEAKLIQRINDTGLVEKLALLRKEEAVIAEDMKRITAAIADEKAKLPADKDYDKQFTDTARRLGIMMTAA